MPFSREQFEKRWRELGESQAPHAVDVAWKRYQQVQDASYSTEPESNHLPSSLLINFIRDTSVVENMASYNFSIYPADMIPWTATTVNLKPGQTVSTWATGRVWRSRELDLWLRPQFALWFKIGVNGRVFNSTGDSSTFQALEEGELYVANQFPGQFGEPCGGRLASPLSVYDNADGHFEVCITVWKDGVNVQKALEQIESASRDGAASLASQELERRRRDADTKLPEDWKLLWFLGTSSVYTLDSQESEPCIHCRPDQNVGILQKDFVPVLPFNSGTMLSWDWLISSLPSRLPEDTSITHDYLSVAFEFENGRDLTYTWSWELPKDYGYWCPLPSWADREYHVVIRSGTGELGQWVSEARDLYNDYVKYIEAGRDGGRVPKQIVRAWFIAGNRWQRYEGDMKVKRLRVACGTDVVHVL